jgi:hypothetical protein
LVIPVYSVAARPPVFAMIYTQYVLVTTVHVQPEMPQERRRRDPTHCAGTRRLGMT